MKTFTRCLVHLKNAIIARNKTCFVPFSMFNMRFLRALEHCKFIQSQEFTRVKNDILVDIKKNNIASIRVKNTQLCMKHSQIIFFLRQRNKSHDTYFFTTSRAGIVTHDKLLRAQKYRQGGIYLTRITKNNA